MFLGQSAKVTDKQMINAMYEFVPTSSENFVIASATGRPAMLGESVLK